MSLLNLVIINHRLNLFFKETDIIIYVILLVVITALV